MEWQSGMTLADLEKQAILKAYRFHAENKTHTANALGITISTLRTKLELYKEQETLAERLASERAELERTEETRAKGKISSFDMASVSSNGAETGLHVEPAKNTSPEHEVPVRKREEVQKLSSGKTTTRDSNRSR